MKNIKYIIFILEVLSMIKLRISGDKKSTDVFCGVINNLKCTTNNKEYLNTDFTVRRYYNIDLSEVTANLEEIKDKYFVSLRISGSEDEIKQMLEVLKKFGAVYCIPDGNDGFKRKKRGSECTLMASCSDKFSAAKRKLLLGDNKNLVII